MKKQINRMVYALLVCLFMCSCKKTDVGISDTDNIIGSEPGTHSSMGESDNYYEVPDNTFVCNEWIKNGFLTEKYALYHGHSGRLQIFDVASRADHVYCFDPGCEHKQSNDPQKLCMAYNISGMTVKYQGDQLYFLKRDGDLICSDRQGENRKVIGRLPSYVPARKLLYSEDALFAIYFSNYEILEIEDGSGEPQWIYGEESDKRLAGIVQVNFTDGSSIEVFRREEYSGMVFYTDIRNEHLYFAYVYSEIPYMTPLGETKTSIPEEFQGLSVEEYIDNYNRRYWMDIYDYDIYNGELKKVVEALRPSFVSFCNGFFAVLNEEDQSTGLYRYTGERFRVLKDTMTADFWCDRHVLVVSDGELQLIDENTGAVIKHVKEPENGFSPKVIIGNSCYGLIMKGAGAVPCYLSTEDFWEGNFDKAIPFNVEP